MITKPLAAAALTMAALTLPAHADQILFSQNFSDSTTVADYIDGSAATIGGNKLTRIGTNGTGASVTIADGALVLQDNGTTGSAGFTIEDLGGGSAPSLMSVQFDLLIDANNANIFSFESVMQVVDHDGQTIDDWAESSNRGVLDLNLEPGGGDDPGSYRLFPSGGGRGGNISGWHTITLFLNRTLDDQTYTFDGVEYTLNAGIDESPTNPNIDGNYSLFVDGLPQAQNLSFARGWPLLEDLRFATGNGTYNDGTSTVNNTAAYHFDNILIHDALVVHEPAGLAVVLAGLGGLLARRH